MKDLGRRFKNKSAFGQIYKIMGVKDCWLYHFFLKEPNLCHNKNVPIKITISSDWEGGCGEL